MDVVAPDMRKRAGMTLPGDWDGGLACQIEGGEPIGTSVGDRKFSKQGESEGDVIGSHVRL